jgi:phosphopantothenoylcysteine decarboxylase/phosphopantothenate--cysteine ligase
VPNPDIIATLAAARPKARVIAFAAEPDADISVAREKIVKKGVFAIAANDISRNDIGFGSENNELTLIQANGEPQYSGKRSKLSAALWLLEKLVQE